jgi:hypothetical protein
LYYDIKKEMKKLNLLFSILFSLLFWSCKKDINSAEVTSKLNDKAEINYYDQFAIILSKAVKENPDIRNFIRQNALFEIDYDHDVFYQFIKDEKITNDSTFKDILKKYESSPNQLDEIERAAPLLTIFVPTIEPSKFSPETWKSASQIPLVATNIMGSDKKIPIYSDGDKVLSLKNNEIPGFPVLVIKGNERIKVKSNSKASAKSLLASPDFEFVSPIFDNLKNAKGILATNRLKASTSPRITSSNDVVLTNPLPIEQSVIDAYNIFGTEVNKWQRDHVYYKLTQTDTVGPLQSNMVESVVALGLSTDAFYKISDQAEDPKPNPNKNPIINLPDNYTRSTIIDLIQKNMWTDGKFEFRFDFLINNKEGIGATYQYFLPLSPADLFRVQYNYTTRTTNGKNPQLLIVYSAVESARGDGRTMVNINIPIINWNIKSNAPIWKISLAEVDTQEEIFEKETVTNEFATNFGTNFSIFKIGFNFGHSNKETFSREISTRRTLGEDNLGSVLVNFGDPILKTTKDRFGANTYVLNSYSNAYFTISVMPVKTF